ncbi:MAG: hypothetical protein J1E82_01010 [Muribaculaceae bacterium]|nr:hypothetical protein [Muribaculaceae bacterium]
MKIQRYQIITFLLAAYALFMTFYFGLDLLKEGQNVRFWVTLVCECIVITLAYFFLKKRDALRLSRKDNFKNPKS